MTKQPDSLFIGVFPAGISYADRTKQEHGDYKRLAFLPYDTLILEWRHPAYKSLSVEMISFIVKDAERVAGMRGQLYPISSCGQTVRLGGRGQP
jgi:hypothetical protein